MNDAEDESFDMSSGKTLAGGPLRVTRDRRVRVPVDSSVGGDVGRIGQLEDPEVRINVFESC
jgi:hypothetical protein